MECNGVILKDYFLTIVSFFTDEYHQGEQSSSIIYRALSEWLDTVVDVINPKKIHGALDFIFLSSSVY